MSEPFAPLLAQLQARKAQREYLATSESFGPLTDEDCQEIDAAMHKDKQPLPGNPLVDGYEARRQARAIELEHGFRRRS